MTKLYAKDDILDMLRGGHTYKQISDALGCSKATISYHAKNAGLQSAEAAKFSPLNRRRCKTCDAELNTRSAYCGSKCRPENQKPKVDKRSLSRHCILCGAFVPPRFRYCSDTCKKRKKALNELDRRSTSNSQAVVRWRQRRNAKAVMYLGGKCANPACGYSRCMRALHFHHKDPTQKDFAIAHKGNTKSWDAVKSELDKCLLLCSNCHSEVHDNMHDISSWTNGKPIVLDGITY